VGDVDQCIDVDGSCGWAVEKINLFTTTVRYGMTRELATISNSTLAHSRITIMRRSENASVRVYLTFGVDVRIQKIHVFRAAVARFVRDREREWIGITSFRLTRVNADLGCIQYVVVLLARESWQQVR
jgi:small-conductance mechanosensitive channel